MRKLFTIACLLAVSMFLVAFFTGVAVANIRAPADICALFVADQDIDVTFATIDSEVTMGPVYVTAATHAPTLLESISITAWTSMATEQRMFRNVSTIARTPMAGNSNLRSLVFIDFNLAANIRGSTADELLIVDMLSPVYTEQATMNPFDAVVTIHAPITSLSNNDMAVIRAGHDMFLTATRQVSNNAKAATPMAQDYALRSMYNGGVAYPLRL